VEQSSTCPLTSAIPQWKGHSPSIPSGARNADYLPHPSSLSRMVKGQEDYLFARTRQQGTGNSTSVPCKKRR